MSKLAELQRDLQEASAAVAHAERTVAAHPNVASVHATLRTIQNRRASLEEQFLAAADELGLAHKEATLRAMRAEETIVVVGELLDVKVSDHTFSMQLSDKVIQGSFDRVISSQRPVKVPKTYQATLKILQKVVVDDGDEEQIDYFLLQLDDPTDAGVLLTDLSDRDS
jgi:hypothetical protein